MAIELKLIGTLEKSEDRELFTTLLKELCQKYKLKIEDYDTTVKIEGCPQGDIICLYDDKNVEITAVTSYAGPGFHAFVCRFYDDIITSSETEFEVEDPCDFYEKREFEELRYNYFYRWLKDIGTYVKTSDEKDLCISWEEDYLPKYREGYFVTPMGYMKKSIFDEETIEEIAQKFFIWNDLEKDAVYYRNCALNLLWKDCVFLYSTMNEKTEKTAQSILDFIEIAYDKNPEQSLPLEAYRLLCETLGKENVLTNAVDSKEEIGYRKELVSFLFNDWKLPIHGSSEKSFDETSDILYFMAPYTLEDGWKWMVRASLNKFEEKEAREEIDRYAFVMKGCKGLAVVCKELDYYVIHAIYQSSDSTLHTEWIVKEESMLKEMLELCELVSYTHTEEEKHAA